MLNSASKICLLCSLLSRNYWVFKWNNSGDMYRHDAAAGANGIHPAMEPLKEVTRRADTQTVIPRYYLMCLSHLATI